MKRLIVIISWIFLLFVGSIYAKGPKDTSYQGAGIGKEVSSEAKEIKESNATKGGFGETVRERARERSRIQLHKQLMKQKKEEKNFNRN